MMKNIYNEYKSNKAVKGLLRVSVIITMVIVWILIDKGNVYGQNLSNQVLVSKQALGQPGTVQAPLFKDGDGSRDGDDDLPIENEDGNEFTIKPNPVEGDLVFDFEFTVKTEMPVEIYDPLGKLVDTGVFIPGVSTQKLDLSRLPTGMYIVRLNLGSKIEVRRIIKK